MTLRVPSFLACASLLLAPGGAACAQAAEPEESPSPAVARPWPESAVWYQIVPDRFNNGDPRNDPTVDTLELPVRPSGDWKVKSWTDDWYSRDAWEKELGSDFYKDGVMDRRYGGDLQGVIEKLDYLKDLGINAISFDPLFVARSAGKFDPDSFHHIDPNFGPDPESNRALTAKETSDPETWKWTAADTLFLALVRQAHARGIRVLLDGVFNHTGRDFFAFRDLRRNQAKSPYKNWYVVHEFDDPTTERNEFRYNGWWGHSTHPEFAETRHRGDLRSGPKKYIFDATKRWMDPDGNGDPSDGIDGWRLDVADEVPAGFWQEWNAFVRRINPAAYTVCSVLRDATELVRTGGFSAGVNYYGFAIPIKGFFIDGRLTGAQLGDMLNRRREALPPGVAPMMQNVIDSGETDRVASMIMNPSLEPYEAAQTPYDLANNAGTSKIYNIGKPDKRARSVQRMIALMQMTYVGAPLIYYGTEAGMWGGDSPDNDMPMVWEGMKFLPQAIDPRGEPRRPDDVNFDPTVYAFYKQVIALRRDYKALNYGEFGLLEMGGGDMAFAFSRDFEDQHLLIVFNRNEEPATIPLKLGETGKRFLAPVIIFTTAGEPDAVTVENAGGSLLVKMPPLTGVVIGGK